MGMKMHELPAESGKKRGRRRIGRGESSGWGKTAGKGHKGAQCRSGSAKRKGFEGGQTPLIRRVPKFGFSNVTFRVPRAAITLRDLNRFDDGATVDIDTLRQAGLVKKSVVRVKVIATGELEKKLTVKVSAFSEGARTAIEAKKGKCEVLGT